jgi:hypothetical protein
VLNIVTWTSKSEQLAANQSTNGRACAKLPAAGYIQAENARALKSASEMSVKVYEPHLCMSCEQARKKTLKSISTVRNGYAGENLVINVFK